MKTECSLFKKLEEASPFSVMMNYKSPFNSGEIKVYDLGDDFPRDIDLAHFVKDRLKSEACNEEVERLIKNKSFYIGDVRSKAIVLALVIMETTILAQRSKDLLWKGYDELNLPTGFDRFIGSKPNWVDVCDNVINSVEDGVIRLCSGIQELYRQGVLGLNVLDLSKDTFMEVLESEVWYSKHIHEYIYEKYRGKTFLIDESGLLDRDKGLTPVDDCNGSECELERCDGDDEKAELGSRNDVGMRNIVKTLFAKDDYDDGLKEMKEVFKTFKSLKDISPQELIKPLVGYTFDRDTTGKTIYGDSREWYWAVKSNRDGCYRRLDGEVNLGRGKVWQLEFALCSRGFPMLKFYVDCSSSYVDVLSSLECDLLWDIQDIKGWYNFYCDKFEKFIEFYETVAYEEKEEEQE